MIKNKGYALQEDRFTAGSRILWITVDEDARVRLMIGGNTLAQDKGDTDYLSTRGAKGNRWKHFGNQGRQSDT